MIAAVSQIKSEKKSISALIMITGSSLLIAAAILNGIKSKQSHIQRHIIRIALSIILINGFVVL